MSNNKNNNNRINNDDSNTSGIKEKANGQEGRLAKRPNTLDEGVIAFGEWLASKEDKEMACGSLILRKYVENMQVLIFGRDLGRDVEVKILDGVPQCKTCSEPDCIHIGFSICASQRHRRNGMVNLT